MGAGHNPAGGSTTALERAVTCPYDGPMRYLSTCLLLLLATCSPAAETNRAVERVFGGYDSCFLLTDADGRVLVSVGGWKLARRLPPCSTFKVPNAIIGLDTGVIPDERHVIRWDGVKRRFEEWNQDLDLQNAVKVSAVWYFQELARRVGAERMQAYVDRFAYGNRDLSAGLTEFWLEKSLKINAFEQIHFLSRLVKEQLPVSRRAQRIAKELIVHERAGDDVVAGKTGSGGDPVRKIARLGWYVGYVVKGGRTYLFAANIQGGENPKGPRCRELVLAALGQLGLWTKRM